MNEFVVVLLLVQYLALVCNICMISQGNHHIWGTKLYCVIML